MMRSRMAETCERFADAIAELKVALQWAAINRSKDDEAQAALDLSKTYVACGNLGLAKSALAQSIAIKPGYPDVVAAMRDLESKPAPAK